MIQAKIIADSVNSCGNRITTFQSRVPKFLLAELNTHRLISKPTEAERRYIETTDLSRNAASTRAIPLKRQMEKVASEPFVPSWWGKNQKGMSASEEVDHPKICDEQWHLAKRQMLDRAGALEFENVHKQTAGRLLEPFLYVDWLATSTDWESFFDLRTSDSAQPEMQELAMLMEQEFLLSEPKILKAGDWHMPYFNQSTLGLKEGSISTWILACDGIRRDEFGEMALYETIKKSTARCARISYETHDGIRDPEEDIKLHDMLAENNHWSPFEHCAHAIDFPERVGNFTGWVQYRKILELPISFEEYLGELYA
jgi:thymidylate synthase ThyX